MEEKIKTAISFDNYMREKMQEKESYGLIISKEIVWDILDEMVAAFKTEKDSIDSVLDPQDLEDDNSADI